MATGHGIRRRSRPPAPGCGTAGRQHGYIRDSEIYRVLHSMGSMQGNPGPAVIRQCPASRAGRNPGPDLSLEQRHDEQAIRGAAGKDLQQRSSPMFGSIDPVSQRQRTQGCHAIRPVYRGQGSETRPADNEKAGHQNDLRDAGAGHGTQSPKNGTERDVQSRRQPATVAHRPITTGSGGPPCRMPGRDKRTTSRTGTRCRQTTGSVAPPRYETARRSADPRSAGGTGQARAAWSHECRCQHPIADRLATPGLDAIPFKLLESQRQRRCRNRDANQADRLNHERRCHGVNRV